MNTYTATTSITAGRDKQTEYQVRYNYTVEPGRSQRLNEPAEAPTVTDIEAEIYMYGLWHPANGCLHDMLVCDDETLDAWLLSEVQESAENAACEAADHRRDMMQEAG